MGTELIIADDPLIHALDTVVQRAREGRYGNGVPLSYTTIEDDLNVLLSEFNITVWFDVL